MRGVPLALVGVGLKVKKEGAVMFEALSVQAIVGWLVVQLIQVLKRVPNIPWVTQATTRVNVVLSAVLAALATVGIALTFDLETGILTVTGLKLEAVVTFLVTWGVQFIWQEVIYRIQQWLGGRGTPAAPVDPPEVQT